MHIARNVPEVVLVELPLLLCLPLIVELARHLLLLLHLSLRQLQLRKDALVLVNRRPSVVLICQRLQLILQHKILELLLLRRLIQPHRRQRILGHCTEQLILQQ